MDLLLLVTLVFIAAFSGAYLHMAVILVAVWLWRKGRR